MTENIDLIPAAQYVRMSTEHQQYSTENQSDKILEYAAKRGIEIVKTYTDAGRSGLSFDGRPALRQLIEDVKSGNANFKIILVYDVSRWGRFQDADESAHYEYTCKQAGIQLIFVAEQFENDGSIASNLIKSLKRTMAGEYSRELSVKVFNGQCRLIELGFRQGGPAGYGLRRVLVDQNGDIKAELSRGEHKSLQTDRVILVPGPEVEIQNVEQMYKWFVNEGFSESEIALKLNSAKIRTDLDREWTRATVHEVLTNEKYIGNNVFNRTSFKLKKKRVVNAAENWVRKEGAFDAVVTPDLFYKAQGIILARTRRYSDEELLERLKNLYQSRGFLSGLVINESDGMPSTSVYTHRFGSLVRAYEMVGFTPDRDYKYLEINKFLRKLHPEIVADTIKKISELGGSVTRDSQTDILTVNDEFTVSIILARCQITDGGQSRWKMRFDTSLLPDVTIAVRLDSENKEVFDYFLLPKLDFSLPRISLGEQNPIEFESYRFDTLDYLYGMAERARVRRSA